MELNKELKYTLKNIEDWYSEAIVNLNIDLKKGKVDLDFTEEEQENEFLSYEDYQKRATEIIEKNGEYLSIFMKQMVLQGLKLKTAENHVLNVETYLNDFLLYYEPLEMKSGCSDLIDNYLGDFFIRKCMWSTPSSVKSTAASIKKFYKCMMENGLVSKNSYDELCAIIKENMEEWQDNCEDFNDISYF